MQRKGFEAEERRKRQMERDEKLKREAEKRGPDILDRMDSELNDFLQDHISHTVFITIYIFMLIGRQLDGPGWFF